LASQGKKDQKRNNTYNSSDGSFKTAHCYNKI